MLSDRKIWMEIDDFFKKYEIKLQENIMEAKEIRLNDGVTNRFFVVKDVLNRQYLVRFNGKLWPPFNRENENDNLTILQNHQIQTNVLKNSFELGFQICLIRHELIKFSEIKKKQNTRFILFRIGYELKNLHQVKKFQNDYPVNDTVNRAYQKLSSVWAEKISQEKEIVTSISHYFMQEKNHQVSSHNDLLPSSVYLNQDKIVFVDWEYSATNHYVYDLAFFSIQSQLNGDEEKFLLSGYDSKKKMDAQCSLKLMKPVIYFLLLSWNLTSQRDLNSAWIFQQLSCLTKSLQEALFIQASKKIKSGKRFLFFDTKEERQETTEEAKESRSYIAKL